MDLETHPPSPSLSAACAPSSPQNSSSAGGDGLQGTSPVPPQSSDPGGVPGSVDDAAECELARRLGVRYDSSNSAWVARWTDTQNDRKKSRWFSIAKYGNLSARRLAIQASLHNMKASDFPSLRDLQDVLTSFSATGGAGAAGAGVPGPGGPAFLVPGDLGGGAGAGGLVRAGGLEGHLGVAGKLGAQFGPHAAAAAAAAQLLQHHPGHNPFAYPYMQSAEGIPTMALGGHPGAGLGMFVQGVPHYQATQGVAPQTVDTTTTTTTSTNSPTSLNKMNEDGSASNPHQERTNNAQESSDLESGSVCSEEDDEENSEVKNEDDGSKRKKRRLDELGSALNTGDPSDALAAPLQHHTDTTPGGGPGDGLAGEEASGEHDESGVPSASHDPSDLSTDAYDQNEYNHQQAAQQQQQQALIHPSYYSMYPGFQQQAAFLQQAMGGHQGALSFLSQPFVLPAMLHPHLQAQAAAAAAAGFLPGHSHLDLQNGDGTGGGSGGGGGGSSANAKMTCERGLHYSKCYQGSQECWIAVWNTKGGRIMHEAFDVADLGFEGAKGKAREARDAAHSNNVAVTENSRPSWKSHSNTGIPHVSLDSQQLRFRAHKYGRRLCRSFSFGKRRGSYPTREDAFDAAVLWLIQTPTEEEIAAVSGLQTKMEEPL